MIRISFCSNYQIIEIIDVDDLYLLHHKLTRVIQLIGFVPGRETVIRMCSIFIPKLLYSSNKVATAKSIAV